MTSTVDPTRQVELAIQGMTCASCASRVERKLNSLRLRRFRALNGTDAGPAATAG